ncbi:MAG TPA: septal ring lytic transglycosylase RlpA family protein [Thermoanaerobaculia bacterium]|nr:septal ring lytic transglycosylase RlpA family protein [Thermoanaerobaculia bacterium]
MPTTRTPTLMTRARRPTSFAALGAAVAMIATLGLAGDARGRAPEGELPSTGRAASQEVFVPGDHQVPSPARTIRGGEASYYHDSLAGNSTASGTPYRPGALTAAHRTLPLGSKVRVTDVDSGRSVVVEVNDRGPFAKDRVIDLSRAAAKRIDMIQRGHTDVRLEVIG